jgi:hypothetical protein
MKKKMKLILLPLVAFCITGIALADELPPLKCQVLKGMYNRTELLKDWNSALDANPFPQFQYYGTYKDESVYIIWGNNVGASVTPESRYRFQIFGTVMQNGVFSDISIKAETDNRKPIDLSMYIPISDISVTCKN